ncbi:MAG: DUF4012 domain-containing protein [Candidatus Daviesbacteria bacterium]|nr:DUF4012 domain-containing protein [Candidatus Daviesbacteria bacterium]
MDEKRINSIQKDSINLSRNTPLALVVGAASFLGAHIIDKLLGKGVQVIGVDDLSTGKKENLEEASKNKNFHFLSVSAEDLDIELPRLDYIYLCSDTKLKMDKILDLFLQHKSRCLLLSSIDLYKRDLDSHLEYLKKIESELAKFAKENNLNARILRLGAVYGPRMVFDQDDPLIKLIQESLRGDLQKDISLEFSTRALYIDDAVELIIKSMYLGSTAQKIFDGVLPSPIKISEIKQILLDPLWYEERNFESSELPPWSTPNLEKTIKILNWRPKTKLIKSLRETISYFKDREIYIPKLGRGGKIEEAKDKVGEEKVFWQEKREEEKFYVAEEEPIRQSKKLPQIKNRLSKFLSLAYFLSVSTLIFYALVWPLLTLGWGVFTFRQQLTEAEKNLQSGDFEKSFSNIKQARWGIDKSQEVLRSFEVLKELSFFEGYFQSADNLINLAQYSADGAKDTILGVQFLYQGLNALTGEINDPPVTYFANAQVELASADENFSRAFALSQREGFRESVPILFDDRVDKLLDKLETYKNLVEKGRAVAILLPEVVGTEEQKDYLILFQNNHELRPTGGFIGSFAKISFEGGKLKNLAVNDIYAIDGQLGINVEPPKEIREDLGQNKWFLRDSNWEADFPTSARQAEWFFNQETGERVEGVVALDISAMEKLLEVIGSLELSDYNETITADNLFERAITHAEESFFAGSQAKKSFLTSLTNQLLTKIFFLPNQNWPGIVSALGNSLETKHMSIYLNNQKLFSYVVSQNWASVLPRVAEEIEGETVDILIPVEANLGANKVNYYLERNYQLETVVGINGTISHRLRINYINRSPSATWPAGVYKNRMRIYLPFGTTLSRVLWGESDITGDVTPFVDYGRSGYSLLLELQPREQRNLILDYQIPQSLDFKEDQAKYRLNIIKQAGTLNDPLEWRLTYPINYQVTSGTEGERGTQELTISTDLSKDRSFEVTFAK